MTKGEKKETAENLYNSLSTRNVRVRTSLNTKFSDNSQSSMKDRVRTLLNTKIPYNSQSAREG